MRRALLLGARGSGQVSPNPLVGAVIVRDGVIVGEGWHEVYGGPHAEVIALRAAGENARGATAYVSLEPCNHHGKTPPCTDALIAAGVTRVVYAMSDPNPKAAGGAGKLRANGIEVQGGICENEALLANASFAHHLKSLRLPPDERIPMVVLKLAVSIDGAIAPRAGTRMRLTGPESQAAVHALRAASDAVAVGIGTALADDPLLTVRDVAAPRIAPRRVVFDRRARLPLSSALVQSAKAVEAGPVIVVTSPSVSDDTRPLENAGVSVLKAETLRSGLNALWNLGIHSLLVEGGATLGSALLMDSLVHHLIIFQAPVILGHGALTAFPGFSAREVSDVPRFRVLERRTFGADLMTRYAVSGD